MNKKYLLVAEGPTDFLVIKEIADKLSETSGHKIDIIEISPQRDATSGHYPRHGWGGIKNWCVKFGNKTPASLAHLPQPMQNFLLRQNWLALVAINNAEGLIIQLDTDIAHLLNAPSSYVQNTCRKTHCKTAILHWLNESPQNNKIYLALTSYALETWLLATHNPNEAVFADLPANFDYEHIEDFESRLIALGYQSTVKKGQLRLNKSPARKYETYGKKIAENLAEVRSRCQEAEQLCLHMTT